MAIQFIDQDPAPSSPASALPSALALAPVDAEFRAWLEQRCHLVRFNPDRWGDENELAVPGVDDQGQFDSWLLQGVARNVGHAFELMARIGLELEAEVLAVQWAQHDRGKWRCSLCGFRGYWSGMHCGDGA